MRNELETMDTISRFLMNRMDATERRSFENEMNQDAALREQTTTQQTLMEGIKRMKLRQEINAAKQTFKMIRTVKTILVGAAVAIGVTAAVIAWARVNPEKE